MSLDLFLYSREPIEKECIHCGSKYKEKEELYWTNITHNLGKMAEKADLYKVLWRPYQLKEEFNEKDFKEDFQKEYDFECEQEILASELIPLIEVGLRNLKERPEYFKQFNASNGWGLYENFVIFVEEYLEACKKYPDAEVIVSR